MACRGLFGPKGGRGSGREKRSIGELSLVGLVEGLRGFSCILCMYQVLKIPLFCLFLYLFEIQFSISHQFNKSSLFYSNAGVKSYLSAPEMRTATEIWKEGIKVRILFFFQLLDPTFSFANDSHMNTCLSVVSFCQPLRKQILWWVLTSADQRCL